MNYFYVMLFSQVIGQTKTKTKLINEVKGKKISHTKLFVGDPGYGGLALALAFLQYLFCENKQKADSCGACVTCKKTSKLEHPDIFYSFPIPLSQGKTSGALLPFWREQVLETPYFNIAAWEKKVNKKQQGKLVIGVAESDEIRKKLTLKSFEGGYKAFVVWLPEEMNSVCANKLLKTLEEPPQKTIFILVSSSLEKIPKTILSRTQKTIIPRIKTIELKKGLQNKIEKQEDLFNNLCDRSNGSVISFLEEAFGYKEDHQKEFVRLMRSCYSKNILEMMFWAEEMASKSRVDQKVFLKHALYMFRQSMLKNYTKNKLTTTTTAEGQFLERFSKYITEKNIFAFTEVFGKGGYYIERNANSKILFTNICFVVMRLIHQK